MFNVTEQLRQWTVQKLNNVDKTHLLQIDSAAKKSLCSPYKIIQAKFMAALKH